MKEKLTLLKIILQCQQEEHQQSVCWMSSAQTPWSKCRYIGNKHNYKTKNGDIQVFYECNKSNNYYGKKK